MPGPIEDEIRTLLTNDAVSVRVLALVLLENRFEELEEGEIRAYLDTALQDTETTVVRQARRVEKAFRNWRLLQSERIHAYNLFEELSGSEVEGDGFLKDYDLTQLREAALDILDPLLVMLKELARDERKRVVAWVIRAVGLLKHPRSLHLLSDLIDEGGHEAAIVEALCRYASPEARVLLLKMAADESRPERIHALRRLGSSDRPEALEILVRALEGSDEEIRAAAAEALGELEGNEATVLLLKILDSQAPPSLLAVAVRALARRKALQAVPSLVRLLGSAKDDELKAAIISALRVLRTDEARHALMLHLTAANDRVRANVVEALSAYALPDDRAMMIFPPLLSDPHPRVRANAVLAVFRYDPRTAEHALEEMFKSFSPKMRAAAAYCAMLVQTPSTARHLTTMLLTEHEVEGGDGGAERLRALPESRVRGRLPQAHHPPPDPDPHPRHPGARTGGRRGPHPPLRAAWPVKERDRQDPGHPGHRPLPALRPRGDQPPSPLPQGPPSPGPGQRHRGAEPGGQHRGRAPCSFP